MKKFKVKRDNKTYIVQAKDAVHATKLADAATQLATINALVTDEQAAISAYNVAIENLDGVVDPKYIEVLRSIVKEENKHIENLQAIVTGNVTEKNVEDSTKDARLANADDFERYLQRELKNNNIEFVTEAYTEADKPVAAYGDGSKTTAANIERIAKSKGYEDVEQEQVDGKWLCWVGTKDSVKDYSRKDFGKVYVSTMKRFGSDKEEVFINWSALGEVDITTAEQFVKDLTSAISYAKSLKV